MKNPLSFLPLTAVCLLAFSTLTQQAAAALQLAKTFGNHMVLQQGVKTSVWGNADPGTRRERW